MHKNVFNNIKEGSRGGAVARAQQCVPGSIPGPGVIHLIPK